VAQAARVLATLHAAHRHGPIDYLVSTCLPAASVQVSRRAAFAAALRSNPYAKEFQLRSVGVLDSTTNPDTSRLRITAALAGHPHLGVLYATCEPDSVNWGVELRARKRHDVLVAAHDWGPDVFTLIAEGWLPWSLGQSPYGMGLAAAKYLYLHGRLNQALPTGGVVSPSVFAVKATLSALRASPDYAAASF